jgi:hypothetical protein
MLRAAAIQAVSIEYAHVVIKNKIKKEKEFHPIVG